MTKICLQQIARGVMCALSLGGYLSLWARPGLTADPSTVLSSTGLPEMASGHDAVVAQADTPGLCPAQLGNELRAIATQPQFARARWGILVQTLDTAQTLYAQEAERFFIPASNAKLLTTAAVLTELGPQHRIRTSIYGDSTTDSDIVLHVVGRGDPSLTDAELQMLARQLHQQGITQIDRLVGIDNYFRGPSINPNWEWEDVQAGYGAPVNSLMVNQNAIGLTLFPQAAGQPLRVVWDDPAEAWRWQVDNRSVTVDASAPEFISLSRDWDRPLVHLAGQLRVGTAPDMSAIAVADPPQHFMQQLRQALRAEQIAVGSWAIAPQQPRGPETLGPEIAAVESAPVAELLAIANGDSNNIYAEALLRQLGASQPQPSQTDSTLDDSIVTLADILAQLPVDASSYRVADGSGLSRHNLVSPEALVQVLQGMAASPQAEVYRRSLAIAGVSGTLTNRFRGTTIAGRLQGKTGAMSGVAVLSGYLNPPHHPPLVFSIMANQFDQPVRVTRQAIDDMVLRLGQLRPCQ